MTHLRTGLACAMLLASSGCQENAIFELTLRLPQVEAGDPQHAFIQFLSVDGEPGCLINESFPPEEREGFPPCTGEYVGLGPNAPFEAPWFESANFHQEELSTATVREISLSVVAEGAQMEQPLAVRILFCQNAACKKTGLDGDILAGEFLLVFERSLFPRSRTSFEYPRPVSDGLDSIPLMHPGISAKPAVPDPPTPAVEGVLPERRAEFIDTCSIEGCVSGESAMSCRGTPLVHQCLFHPDFLEHSEASGYPFPTIDMEE